MEENKHIQIHWYQLKGLYLPELTDQEIAKCRKYYAIPNTRFPEATDCYSYAFRKYGKKALVYFNRIFNFYYPTDFEHLAKGDVAVFRGKNFITHHVAVVANKGYTVGETLVDSKMSNLGVFRYALDDNISVWGIEVSFWKLKATADKERREQKNG